MSILIIGRGHLGCFLGESLGAVVYKGAMSDLKSEEMAQFDYVVNAAGKTDLGFCENNPLEAWRSNTVDPLMVFRLARSTGVTYIHVSSGCLWDGPYHITGKPFGPNDPPTPASFYSWTKAACDAMLLRDDECLPSPIHHAKLFVLRPRQLYSYVNSPRNTLVKLLSYEKLIDTPNTMTSAQTVSDTIASIVNWCPVHPSGTSKTPLPRVINVYDRGVTTPYQVGMMLHEAGLRQKPEAMGKSELDSWHKPKRVDAVLKDEWFESFVGPPDIKSELRRNIELLAARR